MTLARRVVAPRGLRAYCAAMFTAKPPPGKGRARARLALATREGAAVAAPPDDAPGADAAAAGLPVADGGADSGGRQTDVTAPTRSVPGRLLETLSRLLRSSDAVRANVQQHHAADLDAHAKTQALIRELGSLLEPAAHGAEAGGLRVATEPAAASAGTRGGGAGSAEAAAPAIEVYLLSPFRVFVNDEPVEWPPGKGRSIFKYLALQRARAVPREVLMDLFWPDAEPDAARNNLNVAIYGLRKALARFDPDFAFVLFRQGEYSFNPGLPLWVDVEAFVEHVHGAEAAERRGNLPAAMAQYRVAQAIYRSPLLVEDRYERWLAPERQSLRERYVKVLERLATFAFDAGDFESCIAAAGSLLEDDACNEEAHRLLMRCYSRLGQAHLALRQYHLCIDALQRELKLIPSMQTVALSQEVRQRRPI